MSTFQLDLGHKVLGLLVRTARSHRVLVHWTRVDVAGLNLGISRLLLLLLLDVLSYEFAEEMRQRSETLVRIEYDAVHAVPFAAVHEEAPYKHPIIADRGCCRCRHKIVACRKQAGVHVVDNKIGELILHFVLEGERVDGDAIFARVVLRYGGEKTLRVEKGRYPHGVGAHWPPRVVALGEQRDVAHPQREELTASRQVLEPRGERLQRRIRIRLNVTHAYFLLIIFVSFI